MKKAYEDKSTKKQWYSYTIPGLENKNIETQDVLPIFIYGEMTCKDFNNSAWKDFGVLGGKTHTVREYFIPFVLNVTYDYEATSSLQIDFISNDEWKRLSAEDNLNRGPKASIISTSPASLNLGAMDQPIKDNSPFYVGFNLTTTWPKSTQVTGGIVYFSLPTDFTPYPGIVCSDAYKTTETDKQRDSYNVYKFNLSKGESNSRICSYSSLSTTLTAPKKTYTVFADAAYTFSRWESKDTQFNFKDTCWPREDAASESGSAGSTDGNESGSGGAGASVHF
jgi:hypothetical protein